MVNCSAAVEQKNERKQKRTRTTNHSTVAEQQNEKDKNNWWQQHQDISCQLCEAHNFLFCDSDKSDVAHNVFKWDNKHSTFILLPFAMKCKDVIVLSKVFFLRSRKMPSCQLIMTPLALPSLKLPRTAVSEIHPSDKLLRPSLQVHRTKSGNLACLLHQFSAPPPYPVH